jgi:sugar lactone lactonase YvrE
VVGLPVAAQTGHFSGVTVNFYVGYAASGGVALDASGNVFFTGLDTNTGKTGVYEIVAAGGYTTVNQLASTYTFYSPVALAVDASGNVFTSSGGYGTVYEILAPQYTAVKVLPSINSQSSGIAVDKNGNVFVSYLYKNTVNEIPAPGYATISGPLGNAATNNFNQPAGLAVDGNGDVFVADSVNGQVKEMVAVNGSIPANATVNIVESGFSNPEAVALDAYGNLYVTEGSVVKELLAVNGSIPPGAPAVTLGSGFSEPQGVAVDGSGNVYVTDGATGSVYEIHTAGANFGTVNVGVTGTSAMPLSFTFDTAGTLGSTAVLAQGATGLDFKDAGSDTCTAGTAYKAGDVCTVNVKFSPQFPGLRYGSVELLSTTGALIATGYVQGTGVGPNVSFATNSSGTVQPAAQFPVGSGFSNPHGVAVDGSRNIFVADGSGQVEEITAASALTSVVDVGSGFNFPNALAIDGSGNVFVADTGNSAVKEIVAAGGYKTVLTLGSGFSAPYGVAVDGNGNVYVADYNTGDVYEMLAVNGSIPASPTIRTLASGLSGPDGVGVDGSGNVFVALYDTGEVLELLAVNGVIPASPVINTFSSSSDGLEDLAVDGAGNIYVANLLASNVTEFPAAGGYGTILTLGSGFNQPNGIAVDAHGNVLVADTNNNAVQFLDFRDVPSPTFADTKEGFTSSDSPQTVTVTNLGNAPLVFAKPTTGISPSVPAGFTWDPSSTCQQTTPSSPAPFQLAGGASCTMALDFKPTTTGSISGFLQWTDNALNSAGNQEAIQLVGNGTAGPLLKLSATNLSYGSVTVGQASGSQSVTLTNTGSAALTFTSIAVTGTNASSFDFGNSCGTSLAAGASCGIHGHFTPPAIGTFTAGITITDNAGGSPQSIALSGTGANAPPSLSASSIGFGSVKVGTTSASQSVTLTNNGPAVLSIASIAVTGPGASSYGFANSCGTSLAVGVNCTIHGHFAPATMGAFTAAIAITDNAANSPQTIALSGTGVEPVVSLSATSISFPSTKAGSTSASQSVTMTNTGNGALSIASIAVTGVDASSFGFANSCGTSLAVGANCAIHGHFAPATMGAFTAAIAITDNAANSPQTIALSGTGVEPVVSLSATSISFPSTKVGTTSASQSVTMTNTGNGALSITSIAVTGVDASSFGFANNCGTSLAPGASCSIHGHFAPTVTGALTAAITITDSASGSPQSIALSGTGQ